MTAEMIPTSATKLTFWEKFFELQYKMIFAGTESVQNHMYSSEPLEWPLMSRGIAYWVATNSNVRTISNLKKIILLYVYVHFQAQVHLLGNIVIWYSASISLMVYCALLIFYLLRRRRLCYDLSEENWQKFQQIGEIFLTGYLFHFIPYFFVERTLFLHHYLPAFVFKTLLMAAVIEHIYTLLKGFIKLRMIAYLYILLLLVWVGVVFYTFNRFCVLSYGTTPLTTSDVVNLRWKDTWDFIVHRT